MQNVLKSKILIGAILAVAAVASAVVIAMNTGHSGNDLQAQLDLGNKYVSELDYENAIIAYEEALKIDPYCLEAYLGLSDAYMALGQQDKAIEIMERAKSMLPDNVEVYVGLARLYASQNQISLVIATLEEGIQATNSDRLREMLREYQPDGPQLAEAETSNEAEAVELLEEVAEEEPEDESDTSIGIRLRQDRNQQTAELVLTVSQDNGETAEIPLVVPMPADDNYENNSDSNEESQDNGSGNNDGNQENSSDSGSDDGAGETADETVDETVSPALPNTGVTGNVYGINGQGIEGVTISLYSGQSRIPVIVSTDTLGNYVQGLSAGTYRIVLSKEGYADLSTSISVLNNVLTSSSYIMLTSEESRQSASFKGVAINATDSQKIEGVTVALINGFDRTSSTNPNGIQGSTVTGADGKFSMNSGVNAGYYTIEASKDGYSTYHHNETIKPGENEFTINMSPAIQVRGEYRIVLTWGEIPWDLDSHLICSGNTNYHIYYGMKDYNRSNSPEYASLDVDDVTSYGPETITVKIGEGNSYIYAVHNYSNSWASQGDREAWNLAHSDARVVVYSSDGIIFDGSVPTNEQGVTWEVFRIENGRLNVTNKISFDYPGESSGSNARMTASEEAVSSPVALALLENEEAESLPCETENTVQALNSSVIMAEDNTEEETEPASAGNAEDSLSTSEGIGAIESEVAEAEEENAEEGNADIESAGTEAMEEAGEAEGSVDAEAEEVQEENAEPEEAQTETAGTGEVPEGILPSGSATEGKENSEAEEGLESEENKESAEAEVLEEETVENSSGAAAGETEE